MLILLVPPSLVSDIFLVTVAGLSLPLRGPGLSPKAAAALTYNALLDVALQTAARHLLLLSHNLTAPISHPSEEHELLFGAPFDLNSIWRLINEFWGALIVQSWRASTITLPSRRSLVLMLGRRFQCWARIRERGGCSLSRPHPYSFLWRSMQTLLECNISCLTL